MLARVGVPFEPAETCSSGGQELATVHDSFPLDSAEKKSSVVEIMPELNELCGDTSVVPEFLGLRGCVVTPLSVKEVRSDSHEISIVASSPSQTLAFEKSGVVNDVDAISLESSRHVVPIGDVVANSGLLATVPGGVVAREVCNFLTTLVAAYPRSAVD
jgi:hypothetical protein